MNIFLNSIFVVIFVVDVIKFHSQFCFFYSLKDLWCMYVCIVYQTLDGQFSFSFSFTFLLLFILVIINRNEFTIFVSSLLYLIIFSFHIEELKAKRSIDCALKFGNDQTDNILESFQRIWKEWNVEKLLLKTQSRKKNQSKHKHFR